MTFPQPADVAMDEKIAAFDSVPLFMKSLPEGGLNDPVVSALQSLAHEGTPDGEHSVNGEVQLALRLLNKKLRRTLRSRETTISKGNVIEKR